MGILLWLYAKDGTPCVIYRIYYFGFNNTITPTQHSMEEEINDYGNRIAKITLDFIKGEHSEAVRDSMYKDAGYYLLEKLNTAIDLAVSKERGRIVKKIDKLYCYKEWSEDFRGGYSTAKRDIKNLINTK